MGQLALQQLGKIGERQTVEGAVATPRQARLRPQPSRQQAGEAAERMAHQHNG